MTTRLLTAQEVGELLAVPPSLVYSLARAGTIPCVQIGRYKRFDPEAIDCWIKSRSTHERTA